jgi:hypothetical protein
MFVTPCGSSGSRPYVAAAAVLTLGIGGATAIFTLIDAVMRKSPPMANPEALYRIGSGDDCCVTSGPKDRRGLFSYHLHRKSPRSCLADSLDLDNANRPQFSGAEARRRSTDSRGGISLTDSPSTAAPARFDSDGSPIDFGALRRHSAGRGLAMPRRYRSRFPHPWIPTPLVIIVTATLVTLQSLL